MIVLNEYNMYTLSDTPTTSNTIIIITQMPILYNYYKKIRFFANFTTLGYKNIPKTHKSYSEYIL